MADELEVEDMPAPPAGPLPPGMPPANESGFPSLPMFGGEANELWSSLSAAQSVFSMGGALRNGVVTSGMAILGRDQSQAQVTTQIETSRGVIKAELVSQGMLQTSFEGFAPLPFLNLNTQLAWLPQGLAGGVLQSVMLTPVGMLMGCLNTGGQMSAELITGAQPSETSQLMMGAHFWGMPGLLCGVKAGVELQHALLSDEKEPLASSSITLTCTSPFVNADGTPLAARDPSWSLSVFQRLSPLHSLAAAIEHTPSGGTHLMAGGTRQVTEHSRLRGKWGTQGVLALALEVAGERSSITLNSEINTAGALSPRFSASVNLSP